MKTLFELSKVGARSGIAPELVVSEYTFESEFLGTQKTELPEIDGVTLKSHYDNLLSNLEQEKGDLFDEIGKKYIPELGEYLTNLNGLNQVHPLQKKRDVQGSAQLIYRLQEQVKGIAGGHFASLLAKCSLEAQFVVLKMVKKYHKTNGNEDRNLIVVCADNHPIDQDIAKNLGFDVQNISKNKKGYVDLENLKKSLSERVALVVVDLVNELALLDENAGEIARAISESGALSYLTGEQLEPLFSIIRPIDLGFDLVTLDLGIFTSCKNLGLVAVCANERTAEYLPAPIANRDRSGSFSFGIPEKSIGLVRSFYGNENTIARAYAYLSVLGRDGLRNLSEGAILNANYLAKKLANLNLAKVDGCLDRFLFKAKNSKCEDARLKEGVIIKVSASLTLAQLDDYAEQIAKLSK